MWLHRAEALRELRSKVNAAATIGESNESEDIVGIAQITASTLMLCFFEVRSSMEYSFDRSPVLIYNDRYYRTAPSHGLFILLSPKLTYRVVTITAQYLQSMSSFIVSA